MAKDPEIQNAVIRHAQNDMSSAPDMSHDATKAPTKSNAPSTESVLWGEWRRGLKDLQNVVLNAFPQHVAQHEELGTIANPTQLEVNQEKQVDKPDHGLDAYNARLDQAASRGQDSPERGRGR